MKKTILTLGLLVGIFACQKEAITPTSVPSVPVTVEPKPVVNTSGNTSGNTTPVKPICETEKTGTLSVKNYTSNPYFIYANDVYLFSVYPNKTEEFSSMPIGNFEIKAINMNDYSDVRIKVSDFTQCSTVNLFL